MGTYDRQPDAVCAAPSAALTTKPQNAPPRIPNTGALQKVRLRIHPNGVTLTESRPATRILSGLFAAVALGAAGLFAYHASGGDDPATVVGMKLLLALIVLPALAVFAFGVLGSRGVALDIRDQEYRYWHRWLGIPLRHGRVPVKTAAVTCAYEMIKDDTGSDVSATGCLLGLFGPLGHLINFVSWLTRKRKPDKFIEAAVIVLADQGNVALRFITLNTDAAEAFVEQAEAVSRTPERRVY